MKSALRKTPDATFRVFLFIFGVVTLAAVYLFQGWDVAGLVGNFDANTSFVINRATRLVVNDLACILLIYALFSENSYLRLAFWVFLFEFLVILPLYLSIKLSLEGPSEISSPLLSHVHRLIVNPLLMILLIVGFAYQNWGRG